MLSFLIVPKWKKNGESMLSIFKSDSNLKKTAESMLSIFKIDSNFKKLPRACSRYLKLIPT